uniref:Uncharacterized protein LOC104235144 n=1 Tax=Nicotiana sylvestris TaxID=4096 RepID=A0A1U7XKX1_NICSY
EGATGEPAGGPDPPLEDPTQGLSQEPQVSADPGPSPHLYVEPLSVIVPEIRSVSEEQKDDSEAYFDDLPIASLLRRRFVVDEEPTPKRPSTRLQKNEALESALKNSQAKSKRRKLMKDGKVVNEKIVLVMNVDEEEAEEPSEKSIKSDKKEKSVRKTAKRKAKTDEELGYSKKVYEEEVQSFYAYFFKVEDGHICALVKGVDMVMDSALLGSILGVPSEGISSVHGACTQNFKNAILKDKAVQQGEQVRKKFILPVHQLLFEIVNKVLLPQAERRSITSRTYMFLMEALDNFTTINQPAIMIEHINKVAKLKDGNHGLPYGFLLTKVFEHFKVSLGPAKVGSKKQTISKVKLEECECIEKVGGVGNTSTISQLINAQNIATAEIRQLKARNAILETQLSKLQETLGSHSSQSKEVARLTKENAELSKQVEDLKERLLSEQMSANARMNLVLQTIASAFKPSPSSAP